MTIKEVLEFINGLHGKFFSIRFIKRTNKEVREMHCRQGVKKHLKGDEAKHPTLDFKSNKLIPVYDIQAEGYRSIPIEGITHIKIKGDWIEVKETV